MAAGVCSTDVQQYEASPSRSRLAFLPLLVVPSLLVLLALLQAPGRVTFDTDLGLALNPVHLLHRAFHLWSADAGFGGVGDQTYGFLFPMGPFFALGHLAAIPDWLTQRLWCGLVLVVAYEGARRLTHRMVSPHLLVGVLAGVAWALSPRMLTVVGPFSSEAMPVALAPWLLLPLVTYLARDVRKAAWLSGLVVLLLGAANAGATVAVLSIPVLYLATRPTSWRTRLGSFAWWSAAVVLGSLWWVGPLLLFGSYSPPFTDWVESARTTTDPVSALAALRDVTDWVAYVRAGTQGGYWPAAWDLATSKGLALVTTAVGVLGIAGLTSRRLPERRFLVLTALLGFTALTLGHAGSPGSPFDAAFRDLLDGPAVPFRNIYKFDPVLQLPLLLGFAHLVHRAVTMTWPWRFRLLRPVSLALAAALLGVCAVPAFQGDLRPGPAFSAVPSWWTQAAAYLARDGVSGRTLVVPEATAGRYTWGRTIGEPLEALATSPWAVRNQVPLTQAGNTRLVDAIEAVLASGRGSTALADVLARSGVGQLLVRNDLDRAAADALPPARVRQALRRSPGLTYTASFGPLQRFGPSTSTVDGGIDTAPPALEVWTVDRAVAGPHAVPLSEVAALGGGPEDLVSLLESGVVAPDQATVLGAQAPPGTWIGPRVITDGLQRREISFGRVHANTGPLLTAHEAYRQVRAAHDLLPFDADGLQPVAAYDGLVGVTASSSAGYPDNFGGVRLSAQPSAAVDANAVTAWRSGSLTAPVGQWLEIQRTQATDVATVRVRLVDQPLFGPAITSLRLSTDAGSLVVPVAGTEDAQVLALPQGPWRRLRITVASVAGSPRFGVVGIREVALPGLTPTRTVVAPSKLPAGPAAPVVAFRAQEPTEPCVQHRTQRCDPGSTVPGEEAAALDRTFTLPQAATYRLNGTVLPSSGLGLARLLQPLGNALNSAASSSLDGGGAVGAAAAVDGDVRTSWVANPAERLPALAVSWPAAHVISKLRLVHATQPVTSAPRLVHLHSTAGDREVAVGAHGVVRFAPLRVRSVTLTFPELRPELSTSSSSMLTGQLPVGIAEVRVPQVATTARPLPDTATTGALCGFGPTVTIDGTRYATRVSGTIADLRTSSPLGLTLCGPTRLLRLASGTHRMRIESTGEFQVRTAVLRPTGLVAPAPVPRTVTVRRFDATHRSLVVAPGAASLLVVPEAANRGWKATLGGHRLASSVVDGWQQAWVLPTTGGTVHLDYAPDRPYRISLLLGLLAALWLLALVVLSARRSQSEPVMTPPPDPTRRGPVRTVVATGLLALVCFAAGGPVCLAGLAVGALAVLLRRNRLVAPVTWLLVAAAGVVVAFSSSSVPVAQSGWAPQVLCLFAVGLLASQLVRASYHEPPTGDRGFSEGEQHDSSRPQALPTGP